MLEHGHDYQIIQLKFYDTDSTDYWYAPGAIVYEKILKRDLLGNEKVKTFYSMKMKKKSGNDQLVIAAHCASGFHLFDMETNDPPSILSVVCKKIEAFPCV